MADLTVLDGPDAGKQVRLGRRNHIGRDSGCNVFLTDPSVRSRHVRLLEMNGAIYFKELGAPITVNGVPRRQGRLSNGDLVGVGGTTLVFSEAKTIDIEEEAVMAEVESLSRHTTFRRKYDSSASTMIPILERGDEGLDRLEVLTGISNLLQEVRDPGALLEGVLDEIMKAFPADRASVVLVDGEGRFRVGPHRGGLGKAPPVSRGLLREVFKTRESLLLLDAQSDDRFSGRQSVMRQGIRSVLSVPMMWRDEFLGALTLDTSSREAAFTELDLTLLSAVGFQIGQALKHARLAEEAREKAMIERELELAADIQQRALPQEPPDMPDVDVYGVVHPAGGMCGNFYDYVKQHGSLYMAFGDIDGSGLEASLLVMMAKSFLRSLIRRRGDIGVITAELNKHLVRDTLPDAYMTFLLLRLREGADRIEYCEGGHDLVLLLPPGGGEPHTLPHPGLPLGRRKSGDPLRTGTLPFPPGALCLVFSDGVVEAQHASGARFGITRLREALSTATGKPLDELVASILGRIREFTDGQEQEKDITLLAARRRGGA